MTEIHNSFLFSIFLLPVRRYNNLTPGHNLIFFLLAAHMKDLKIVTILTLALIVISASKPLAQARQSRTGSAKAAYGYPTEFNTKSKKKKEKKRKAPKRKTKAPITRQRNPWAG